MNSCDDFGSARTPAAWAEALSLMRRALALLDETCSSPEIGAHLDLAANRLELSMPNFGIGELGEPALVIEVV